MGKCKGHHKLKNKHPSLHYHKTYSNHDEAAGCWHVQTAAQHHNVSLSKLVRLLAGGINLLSAVVSLAAFV